MLYYNKSYVNVAYLSQNILLHYVHPSFCDDQGMELVSVRFHHFTQNGTSCKTNELFINYLCLEVFCLIFLSCSAL